MNSIVIYDHEDDYHKVNDDTHRDTHAEPATRVPSIHTQRGTTGTTCDSRQMSLMCNRAMRPDNHICVEYWILGPRSRLSQKATSWEKAMGL